MGKVNIGLKGKKHPSYKNGSGIGNSVYDLEKLAGKKKSTKCEICGDSSRICFDHDHKTGEFRGWICWKCNLALGMVKDNNKLLIKLAKYLQKHET